MSARRLRRDVRFRSLAAACVAADSYAALVGHLVAMRAETFDGVVATARAFAAALDDDRETARRAQAEFETFGPDESVLARALAGDPPAS